MTLTSAPGVPRIHARSRIVEVDVSRPLPELRPPKSGEPDSALVVVWLCREPAGMILVPGALASSALADRIQKELGLLLSAMLPRHGLKVTELTAAGFSHDKCPVNIAFETASVSGPAITVVLCTRDRSDSLRRCIESVAQLAYSNFELIVIDNAPTDDASERACADLADLVTLKYFKEPVPGLSWARNRGIGESKNSIIAFIDDDERVHSDWLTGLALEFTADARVGVVSGLVLPAELRTESQVNFERFGGHSKGRGFARVVFDQSYQKRHQSPLYPFPPFGVGANMAFRRRTLDEIGGFDVALGAGTVTGGAEDTTSMTEALLAGWTVVYAPQAVTWHYHRPDEAGMDTQLDGYARGIGAYYTALLLRDPRRLIGLMQLVVPALREWKGRRHTSEGLTPSDPSAQAISDGNTGLRIWPMLGGPFAYLKSRRIARNRRSRVNAGE